MILSVIATASDNRDNTTTYRCDTTRADSLTNDGKHRYDYAALNRMTSSSPAAGTPVTSYTYYIDGLRKSKRTGNVTTCYIWLDGNMRKFSVCGRGTSWIRKK